MTGRTAILALAIAAAVPCVTAATHDVSPRALRWRAAADRNPVFAQTLAVFEQRCLAPDLVDPPAMLAAGLQGLAPLAELEVRVAGANAILSSGGRSVRVPLGSATDLEAVAAWLDAAVAWAAQPATQLDPAALEAAALRAAVRSADRWATVISGAARDRLLGRFRGSLSGIGCRLGRREGQPTVLEVFPQTPAADAGLRAGDRLLAIDGVPVGDDEIGALVARLRGAAGSRVEVTLGDRQGVPRRIALTRRRVAVPTVSSRMLGNDVGYLRIRHIAQNSAGAAQRIIGGLREATALRAIILDLRGNSGGSVLAAAQIADQFVDRGVLIETRGRGGHPAAGLRGRIDATSTPSDGRPEAPIVILVDEQTGSSAELLAAALVRHDRAVLIGSPTVGKGVVQKVIAIGNGMLTLKVTVARSFAAGRGIPSGGLAPDVLLTSGAAHGRPLRCAGTGAGGDGAVATADLAPDDLSADPALTVARRLIDRYDADSRHAFRAALRHDLCPAAPIGADRRPASGPAAG